jgi:hypothetical protein
VEQKYSSTLSTSGLHGGGCTSRPGRFTPGKDPVPIVQEARWVPGPVWTGVEYLVPTGIRSPDRPARSESLYRVLKGIALLYGAESSLPRSRNTAPMVPIVSHINLVKPTGHVMHHQFIIQQLYALPTLYLSVLYLSQNKQRLVPLTA